MLNEAMDAVVLVKGWKKGASWSFPRGKISKDETDIDCAIRETQEETGFDLEEAGLVPADRQSVHSIPFTMKEQDMRMFVFRNVPMDTRFETQTRKEIGAIDWWQLSDLPAFKKKGKQAQPTPGIKSNQFFMVAPFLAPLRRWVIDQKKLDAQRNQRPQVTSILQRNVPHRQEILTDEDQDTDTQGAGYTDVEVSEYDQDQVLDSTAIINRLFRGQQRPEDFMAAAPTPPPAPPPQASTKRSGDALLALLHGNQGPNRQLSLPNPPLHTPMEQIIDPISMPTMPRNPHPQHPQHAPDPFAFMPPPPPFPPMGAQNNSFRYHQQEVQHAARNDSFQYQQQEVQHAQQQNNIRQRQVSPPQQSPRNQGPHPYQPQHLIHPQPLPPHVQRAVFTGGPVHAPMVPPPVQQQQPQYSAPISVKVSNPQFTGLHAPMVSQVQKQNPPKLTAHSLALLDAFKRRDQADLTPPVVAPEYPSQRGFEQSTSQPHHSRPQEVPGQAIGAPYNQQRHQETSRAQAVDPNMFAARPPISDNQRTTLLGLFKSPITPNAVPASATALPRRGSPSAVELSAVEPLSENAATTSALLNDRRKPSLAIKNAPIPEMHPESNLPYGARIVLARPHAEELIRREERYSRSPPRAVSKQMSHPLPDPPSPKQVFQPQILKRPQSGSPQVAQNVTPTQASYTTYARPLTESRRAQPSKQFQHSPQSSNHIQPMVERQAPQPPQHKQALLSLFGKSASPMAASEPMTKIPSNGLYPAFRTGDSETGSPSLRSRVNNLASAEGTRRSSGSSLSPTDTGFLLGYLESVVKGA